MGYSGLFTALSGLYFSVMSENFSVLLYRFYAKAKTLTLDCLCNWDIMSRLYVIFTLNSLIQLFVTKFGYFAYFYFSNQIFTFFNTITSIFILLFNWINKFPQFILFQILVHVLISENSLKNACTYKVNANFSKVISASTFKCENFIP
jgi:hypothetical protein